jgi:hypothetical protein
MKFFPRFDSISQVKYRMKLFRKRPISPFLQVHLFRIFVRYNEDSYTKRKGVKIEVPRFQGL